MARTCYAPTNVLNAYASSASVLRKATKSTSAKPPLTSVRDVDASVSKMATSPPVVDKPCVLPVEIGQTSHPIND